MPDRFYIELSDKHKADIVIKELEDELMYFQNELKEMQETGRASGYMSWELEEDTQAINEAIEHFKFVLAYYKPYKG